MMKMSFVLVAGFLTVTAEANSNPLRRACLEAGGTPRVLDAGSGDDLMTCRLRDGAHVGAFDLLVAFGGGTTPVLEAYKAKSGCTGSLRERTDSDFGTETFCEFVHEGNISAIRASMLTDKRLYPELDRILR